MKAAASAGTAPAVLSELAVAAEVATGSWSSCRWPGSTSTRALRAVWLAARRPTGPAADLVRVARG